jgi:hypothetical protein
LSIQIFILLLASAISTATQWSACNSSPLVAEIDEVFINSLVEKKLTPKIRTQMLLDHLQEKLNPWMKALKNNLQTTLKPFNNSKLSVQVDPSFESSDISVEFNFQSKQELMENLSQLGQLPVEKIQSLLLGETHD